jgi:hypothetical protein
MLTFPKDTAQFSWTRHIKNKMVFYHISGAQILRIFRKPNRREEGIAPGTSACMQGRKLAGSSKGRAEEIWIMYRMNKGLRTKNKERESRVLSPQSSVLSKHSQSRITLISAWRYPGVTKPGERPLIPADIAEMLERGIY